MEKYDVVFLTGVCHPVSFNRAQGAYRLASVLRNAGYSVRVIDGVGNLSANKIKEMIELVVSPYTKLFCISTTFFSNFSASVHSESLVTTDPLPYSYDEWMSIIGAVKKQSTAKIIMGGHKTAEFERNKQNHPYIDHFIYGYADKSIISLMGNKVQFGNMSEPISSDEYTNYKTRYDIKDSFLPGESFTIEMQRGCMFRCSFCAYPMNGKKKGTYGKDAKHIVDELKYCYDTFGSTNFILNSDTFNDSIEYLDAFYTELSKENIKFNFGINARLDLFYKDPDLMKICKDIGVRSVLFGLESSNPFSLKEIGKGLPFEKVVDTLHECKSMWGNQVRMTGSYIIGLPFDTEQNINQVYDFFASKECPLHGIEFDPLYVQNAAIETNPWKSEYTVNAKKHGFTFEEGSMLNWENDNTPYKSFTNSVIRAEEMVSSLPQYRKGTIKSAAYMHLPNNLDNGGNAADRFERIFTFNTYKELNDYYSTFNLTASGARMQAAERYYNLFMQNNR